MGLRNGSVIAFHNEVSSAGSGGMALLFKCLRSVWFFWTKKIENFLFISAPMKNISVRAGEPGVPENMKFQG